jgi:hypothetical protein
MVIRRQWPFVGFFMCKRLAIPICIALSLAGASRAQTLTDRGDVLARLQAEVLLGVNHPGQSSAKLIAPVIGFAPRETTVHGAAALADGPKTAIDYRIGSDGAFGSLGYVCDNDNHPPAPHDVGVLAGSQNGRVVGGTLRLPFR